jgi:hypothetical protein
MCICMIKSIKYEEIITLFMFSLISLFKKRQTKQKQVKKQTGLFYVEEEKKVIKNN